MIKKKRREPVGIPLSYQQDKDVVTFELYGQADGLGRHHFAIFWWMEGFHAGPSWRAQHFRDNYGHHLEEWRKKGRRVVVVQAST